jgi:hypothetical protein
LWELANAEVEMARVKAAARVISCFMNVSEGWSEAARWARQSGAIEAHAIAVG